jgi:outer membrane murein-binding lipoprotein Lpp
MNHNERRLIEKLGCDPEEVARIEVEVDFFDFSATPPGTGLILLSLGALHRKVDRLMADISALEAAVDALAAAEGAAVGEIGALKDEIAQLNAGEPLSQEKIDAITQRVTDVTTALTSAAQEAPAGETPPGESPAGETPPGEAPPAEAPPAGGEPPAEEPQP